MSTPPHARDCQAHGIKPCAAPGGEAPGIAPANRYTANETQTIAYRLPSLVDCQSSSQRLTVDGWPSRDIAAGPLAACWFWMKTCKPLATAETTRTAAGIHSALEASSAPAARVSKNTTNPIKIATLAKLGSFIVSLYHPNGLYVNRYFTKPSLTRPCPA